MKVFISSTYNDLIEHRKAAHEESHPQMRPRIHEWALRDSSIRKIFVDGCANRITP